MSDKSRLPDLSEPLKSGLIHALESYERFKTQEIPSDAKGFTAYHNACKSALSHIALLVKLCLGNQAFEESTEQNWVVAAHAALDDGEDENDDLFSA